jgi:hypothetical protein
VQLFNILDYGAVGDGTTLNTQAIVAAVNAAKLAISKSNAAATTPTTSSTSSISSGGSSHDRRAEVLIPAPIVEDVAGNARFLAGAFSLASNVFLRIEAGATLVASTNMSDYPFSSWNWTPALITTKGCANTGVVGGGIIDGQAPGPYWSESFDANRSLINPRTWEGFGPDGGCVGECRPTLVRFVDCSNIVLQGDDASTPLKIHNSPDWTVLFRRAENVRMQYLDVYGDSRWPNNDGVDFESVVGISVLDSVFNTGDDGIVFDSGNCNNLRVPFLPQPPPATRSAVLRNLTIKSHSSAIKFEQIFQHNHSAIQDMVIEDIRILGSSRGLGMQQRTGAGTIANITFRNIQIETMYPTGDNWWGSGEAIWISNVAESANPHATNGGLSGTIRDIVFENISIRSENSVLLSGLTKAIGPLTFTNIDLTIGVYGNVTCAKGNNTMMPTGCRDIRPYHRPLKDGAQVPTLNERELTSDIPAVTTITRTNTSASGCFSSTCGMFYGSTHGFILEGQGAATFTNVSIAFQGPRQPFWAACVKQGPGWGAANTTWVGGRPAACCTEEQEFHFDDP